MRTQSLDSIKTESSAFHATKNNYPETKCIADVTRLRLLHVQILSTHLLKQYFSPYTLVKRTYSYILNSERSRHIHITILPNCSRTSHKKQNCNVTFQRCYVLFLLVAAISSRQRSGQSQMPIESVTFLLSFRNQHEMYSAI